MIRFVVLFLGVLLFFTLFCSCHYKRGFNLTHNHLYEDQAATIESALEALKNHIIDHGNLFGSFVVIESCISGDAIQFVKPRNGEIYYDIPVGRVFTEEGVVHREEFHSDDMIHSIKMFLAKWNVEVDDVVNGGVDLLSGDPSEFRSISGDVMDDYFDYRAFVIGFFINALGEKDLRVKIRISLE